MNEVFLDHVRQYFDYTNDLDLMREIFPVLEGALAWESRRLQPDNEGLYENALNTWISDSHWYTRGQCTQASAYMLGANRLVADLAARLGKDPTPFQEQADRIREAMQDKLWLKQEGVFAEYLDTRGNRLLHPEPELPTIYHAAEFGAADPMQIYQMLHWADTHLRTDTTPDGGKIVWSSNWFPNRGRSYTHSTYEMAYGEELNFALTNYLAGRAAAGLRPHPGHALRHLQRPDAGRPVVPCVRGRSPTRQRRVRRCHQHVGPRARGRTLWDRAEATAGSYRSHATIPQAMAPRVHQDAAVLL